MAIPIRRGIIPRKPEITKTTRRAGELIMVDHNWETLEELKTLFNAIQDENKKALNFLNLPVKVLITSFMCSHGLTAQDLEDFWKSNLRVAVKNAGNNYQWKNPELSEYSYSIALVTLLIVALDATLNNKSN